MYERNETMHNNNKYKHLAVLLLGLVLLVIVAGTGWLIYNEYTKPDIAAPTQTVEVKYPISVTIPAPPTEPVNSNESEADTKSILLIDASGSMPENSLDEKVIAEYAEVRPFTTGIYSDTSENESRIATAVNQALADGYDKIGVWTDLDSYPANEADGLRIDTPYQNRVVEFFCTSGTEEQDIIKFDECFTALLDKETCTLKFHDADTTDVGFDNYSFPEPSVPYNEASNELVEVQEGTVIVEVPVATNNIDPIWFVIAALLCMVIVLALVIALIATTSSNNQDVNVTINNAPVASPKPAQEPDSVEEYLRDPECAVVLDVSGSVKLQRRRMIRKAMELRGADGEVYTFGKEAKKLTLTEVENLPSEGDTLIAPVLDMLMQDGVKKFIVLTDGQINDYFKDTHQFDEVTIVKVGSYNPNFTKIVAQHCNRSKLIKP